MMIRNLLNFLVPLVWFLVLLGVGFYLRGVWRRRGVVAALRTLYSYQMLIPLTFALAMTVIRASAVFIEPHQVGVVISILQPGGLRSQPLDAGLHWIVPLAERVKLYPLVIQTYTMSSKPTEGEKLGDDSIAARTADGQLVILDISIMFRLDPAMINDIHVFWQDRYVQDLVRPGLRAMVRTEASKYTVDEINSQRRQDFQRTLDQETKDKYSTHGIMVEYLLLRNVAFSPEYAASVEEKMMALQGVTQTEYEAQQIANIATGEGERITVRADAKAKAIRIEAEAQADAIVLRGDAEAEALEALSDPLEERPDLLVYRYVDKLSPAMRAMLVPANAPLILPLPNLDDEVARPAAGDTSKEAIPPLLARPPKKPASDALASRHASTGADLPK